MRAKNLAQQPVKDPACYLWHANVSMVPAILGSLVMLDVLAVMTFSGEIFFFVAGIMILFLTFYMGIKGLDSDYLDVAWFGLIVSSLFLVPGLYFALNPPKLDIDVNVF